MAFVTGAHPELSPELRKIAQALLDGLEPAVRAAAAAAAGTRSNGEPGKCQQVWCPACALAALATGEQHPLIDIVADHSIALFGLLRAMVEDPDRAGGDPHDVAPAGSSGDGEPPTRYQSIPFTVET